MLVDDKPNTTVMHIESNNITKLNYQTINSDSEAKLAKLAKGIVKIGLKCKHYWVRQIAILSILARSNNDINNVEKHVFFSFKKFV